MNIVRPVVVSIEVAVEAGVSLSDRKEFLPEKVKEDRIALLPDNLLLLLLF